eukprot:2371376-Rhodomonas_salina.2
MQGRTECRMEAESGSGGKAAAEQEATQALLHEASGKMTAQKTRGLKSVGPPSTALEELLVSCNLQDSVEVAWSWFESRGFESIAEIKKPGMEQELVKHLQLTDEQANMLLAKITSFPELGNDGEGAALDEASRSRPADRLTADEVLDVVDKEQLRCYLEHTLQLTSSVKDSASGLDLQVDNCVSLKRVEIESLDESAYNVWRDRDLICPISHDFMRDPVQLSGDGKCYERKEIEVWLAEKKVSPWTRQALEHWRLEPQPQLLAKIRASRE